FRGPGRRRWLAGAAPALALIIAGAWWWWRGRPERHLGGAERLLGRGGPAAARAWLELPESTPATRGPARLLRARVALALGRPAEAVAPLEAIDPGGPLAADAAFWKGRTLYEARQYVLAIGWFKQTLARRPGDAAAHRWIAAACYDLGARELAVASL